MAQESLYIDPETGEVRMVGGRERPDPTPIAPPVGYKRQPTMVDHIKAMVRSQRLAEEAAAAGKESFEDAEDFDVGDDLDPPSPYETELLDGYMESAIREGRLTDPEPEPPSESLGAPPEEGKPAPTEKAVKPAKAPPEG